MNVQIGDVVERLAEQKLRGKGVSFDDWMKMVDKQVQRRAGCSVYDLPDCCYNDLWEAGRGPSYAANHAIKNAEDE